MDPSCQKCLYDGTKDTKPERKLDKCFLQNNTFDGNTTNHQHQYDFTKNSTHDYNTVSPDSIGNQEYNTVLPDSKGKQVKCKVLPYKPNISLHEKIQICLDQQNITDKIMETVIQKRSDIRFELKKLRRRGKKNMKNITHDHTYSQSLLHFPSCYTGIPEPRNVHLDSEIEDLLADIM